MAATPENGGEPAEDEAEFDRFHDLARKLAQVPKHEVDAERAKEREHKKRERQPDEEG